MESLFVYQPFHQKASYGNKYRGAQIRKGTTKFLNFMKTMKSFVQLFHSTVCSQIFRVYFMCSMWKRLQRCSVAFAKNKKSLNFASSSWWHLKVGMETPENDFQIYRPINDPRRAVCSLERGYRWGNIQIRTQPNSEIAKYPNIWLLDIPPPISPF